MGEGGRQILKGSAYCAEQQSDPQGAESQQGWRAVPKSSIEEAQVGRVGRRPGRQDKDGAPESRKEQQRPESLQRSRSPA